MATGPFAQKHPTPYLLPDVFVSHIAGAALGDKAGPLAPGAAAVRLVLVLRQAGQEETIGEEALPGQHGANRHNGKSVQTNKHTNKNR